MNFDKIENAKTRRVGRGESGRRMGPPPSVFALLRRDVPGEGESMAAMGYGERVWAGGLPLTPTLSPSDGTTYERPALRADGEREGKMDGANY